MKRAYNFKANKESEIVYERLDHRQFYPYTVIGLDEVGRGCLAGRVYAGAVIINDQKDFQEFTDSKVLTEGRRDILVQKITADHMHAVSFATPREIDQINILQASFLAMRRALKKLLIENNLDFNKCILLVDGHLKISKISPQIKQVTLIKGDLRCSPISAASILAKVTRDQYMKDMALRYPQYSFEKHKGYGSAVHREAIQKHKPTVIHRHSFSGVKEYL